LPETVIVKSEGFFVPPLVLSTFVITFKNVVDPGKEVNLFVIVHRLIFLPPLILPEHPEEYVVVYPEIDDDETLYLPGFSVTIVPKEEPENDFGLGLLPETVMVKSEGLLIPPDTFVVTLIVPNNPGVGTGGGAGISEGLLGMMGGPGRIL
jgi:hypothetical protein